jgi:HEAT repeat protein
VINLGLADLFSKEARSQRSLQKLIQKANDKHAQPEDRFGAFDQLRQNGSSEAIIGLMRRFSFTYDKSIRDEEEKEWIYHTLVDMGEKILPELRRYMKDSETLGWALKILEQIAKGDTFRETLKALCEQNDNSYVRDPGKKTQLVHFMGEHRDPEIAQLIIPYLEDIDEGVRFKAVEALLAQGQPQVVLGPLIALLTNKAEESRRIKIRIAEGLAELKLPVGERASEVERALNELGLDGRLDKGGRIQLSASR